MYDLLIELKEYIKEHYTGSESFEPVIRPLPHPCENSVRYGKDDIEETKNLSREKDRGCDIRQVGAAGKNSSLFA